ncbi:MAG: DUF4292 domain-containing protein [Lentimicrobiaceae bacterium]
MKKCMNSYIYRFIKVSLILSLVVSLAACSGSRKAVRQPIKEQGDVFLMSKLKEHEFKFHQFSAKFNVTYQVNREKTSVSGNLRIKNDSIIWISISPALGIEAVRFMLTPDSIKYINRLSKTYLVKDFAYINHLINKTMDYNMAQAFLIGNDFSFYDSSSFKASIDNQEYKLSTINRRKLRRYVRRSEEDISIPIQSIWLDSESFKISKVLLKEAERDSRKFVAKYAEFENIDKELIPTRLDFLVETNTEKIRIKISYSKIQIDQDQTYPFTIPDNYSEITDLQQKK